MSLDLALCLRYAGGSFCLSRDFISQLLSRSILGACHVGQLSRTAVCALLKSGTLLLLNVLRLYALVLQALLVVYQELSTLF